MSITAILGAATALGFNPLDSHPKDTERLGRNQIAYTKAIAGDDNALKFLLYRSQQPSHTNGYVKYDSAYMGSLGSADPNRIPVEGWPTTKTRDDARAKYNDALTKRQQVGTALTGLGVGIGSGSEGETAGTFTTTVAGQLGITSGRLLLVAVGIVVLVLIFKGRR